ncbi:unnamed protein product [Spirodela intermedia]|uniref:14-3-3 domain-containing protein n=1 Tax=Spirodela intermedia TaxID=51605 RepID=A0A7I8J2K1_SPIIN|nr:unnamed protein product [Spirodela intermedia]CAA6664378.1 unnamed protein product [Spirodela intermedia]
MVEFMEKVVAALPEAEELTVEERNLLSVAYKNVVSSRRSSWRVVCSIEQKEVESHGEEWDRLIAIRDYRARIESELSSICETILRILERHLVPSATADDAKVFFLKMKGDYHRYLAEFLTGAPRKEAADSTLSCYKAAQVGYRCGKAGARAPVRLGVALNFSVFYFEILNSYDKACTLAKQESYKDSTLVMQLLRDKPYALEYRPETITDFSHLFRGAQDDIAEETRLLSP